MPRPPKAMPSYRYHVSGQAVVTLAGKDFYVGKFDSPQSRARYLALVAEYNANGMQAPDQSQHQGQQTVTVRCVTAEYRDHIDQRPKQLERYRKLCDLLDVEYADTPASEFGPRKLRAVRDIFVASGNCRSYANDQTRSIVRIFRHAVSRELIDIGVLSRLETLEPLRQGQAADSEPRVPVSIEHVRATAAHLSPTLRAMVRVQLGTGMRPGEVCSMRPCDIDRSGDEWMYRPTQHKNSHRRISKAVPILGDAREAIIPFLERDPEAFCFSPKDSYGWSLKKRREARVTPENQGNRPGTNRSANPRSIAGDHYTAGGYRQGLQRAAKAAGVPKWTPYQIRHLTATVIRDALCLEGAQALLGHSSRQMTEHYARVSEKRAIEAARAAPSLGSSRV